MMKKTIYISFLFGAMAGFVSCKKHLDINTDPNSSDRATVNLVLPSAQIYTAYNMGNPFQILGGLWGQFWTQGPTANQYNNLEQYSIQSTSYNTQWQSLYAGPLKDLRYIEEEAGRLGRSNYVAVSKFMQAYIFQYLTDLHGDIPFSEAINPAIITPKFDSQEAVYDGLIKMIDEGLAAVSVSSTDHPDDDDLIYEGNMDLWKRFGNTLKLRVYLRQAYVRPNVAQAGIQKMYAEGAQFLREGEDADIQFFDDIFNQHPLYATFDALGTANLLASNTSIHYLETTNDPRIEVFYTRATLAPNAGQFAGLDQGIGKDLTGTLDANMWSKPGAAVGGPTGGSDAPVVLMSAAESYFLQAEAAARGWGNGNAETLYENGIHASFSYWGLEADADAFIAQAVVAYPAAGSLEERLDAIITQKWVSMNGTQNVEAWTEWRRTGYPDMFTVSAASNIGNSFPVRILYADSEVSRNPNTPPQKQVTDKVWWDVNTTGQN